VSLDGRLDSLRSLEANWNGYGEEPITEAALHAAGSLHFSPLSHGGIQVELHVGGRSVEIEIDPKGQIISSCLNIEHGPAPEPEAFT
jgi:hypothetical protein